MLEYATYADPQIESRLLGPIETLGDPWRMFEKYIMEYKPAIGFPHFSWHGRNESLEVQSVSMFDAMITAFHRDIWSFVFPYETRWDSQASRGRLVVIAFRARDRLFDVASSVSLGCFAILFHSFAVVALVPARSFCNSQHVFPSPSHSIQYSHG